MIYFLKFTLLLIIKQKRIQIIGWVLILFIGALLESLGFYFFALLINGIMNNTNHMLVLQGLHLNNSNFGQLAVILLLLRTLVIVFALSKINKNLANLLSNYSAERLRKMLLLNRNSEFTSSSEVARSMDSISSNIFSGMQNSIFVFSESLSIIGLVIISITIAKIPFFLYFAFLFLLF